MQRAQPSTKTPATSRWSGRLRVIDHLRHKGPAARIDISQATGFSPATVTAITSELINAGVIEVMDDEVGGTAKRGRPRSSLRLRAGAALVAGLKVGTKAITVMLHDFLGHEIAHSEYDLPARRSDPAELCSHIILALQKACSEIGLEKDALAGAVVGLAGYVNGAAGFVHWSSAMTTRNVDLTSLLQASAPCPISIENDANLVAQAEYLFGKGKELGSFLLVTVEHGIGLGIMMDGRLHRGTRGCGAEFGHTKVTLDGAVCQCGQRGCLEAYAGEYALVARTNAALEGKGHISSFEEFRAALAQGHPQARAVLAEAEKFFAMGLANLINLFDPPEIVIASKVGAEHPLISDAMLSSVQSFVVQLDSPLPRFTIQRWGDLMWAKGAAAQALNEVSTRRAQGLASAPGNCQ